MRVRMISQILFIREAFRAVCAFVRHLIVRRVFTKNVLLFAMSRYHFPAKFTRRPRMSVVHMVFQRQLALVGLSANIARQVLLPSARMLSLDMLFKSVIRAVDLPAKFTICLFIIVANYRMKFSFMHVQRPYVGENLAALTASESPNIAVNLLHVSFLVVPSGENLLAIFVLAFVDVKFAGTSLMGKNLPKSFIIVRAKTANGTRLFVLVIENHVISQFSVRYSL